MDRKKVLFVGSFVNKAKDGSVGGQMFACRSLIASELSNEFEWILLDVTGKSVPPPPVYIRLYYVLLRLLKYAYLLIFKKPDTTLIFSPNGLGFFEKGIMAIMAALLNVRVVFAPRGGPLDMEVRNSRFTKQFLKYVLKHSDIIICQGNYWKRFFSSYLPTEKSNKCIVIRNWIDLSQYDISDLRNVQNDTTNVLYMGWIQEDKGVFDLADAINKLPKLSQKINFYFLGDGPGKAFLINRLAESDGRVRYFFPGWVHGKEKLEYLANSDIFVLASHGEGMPNSLMEAMACGVASIATNVGAVPDLIENRETGIIVKPMDVEALSIALQTLLADVNIRSYLSKRAKERIIANHSISSAVEHFKKIL